jgi:hypothetical protein
MELFVQRSHLSRPDDWDFMEDGPGWLGLSKSDAASTKAGYLINRDDIHVAAHVRGSVGPAKA